VCLIADDRYAVDSPVLVTVPELLRVFLLTPEYKNFISKLHTVVIVRLYSTLLSCLQHLLTDQFGRTSFIWLEKRTEALPLNIALLLFRLGLP